MRTDGQGQATLVMKDGRHILFPFLSLPPSLQLALSASSPVFRGYLADIDCRWNVISGSVDDRTKEERGLKVR